MNKPISTLVVIGFSLLLTFGLGTGLFLYIKLQQRIDDAVAETLLLNRTHARMRDAQVIYMSSSQKIAEFLLNPLSRSVSDEKDGLVQDDIENATALVETAIEATRNPELKETLRKLIHHNREVMLPLRNEILLLATTDLDAAKTRFLLKYLPEQTENMALMDESIGLSSNQLNSFNETANRRPVLAQSYSLITFFLFACLGIGIAIFVGRAVTRLEQELRLRATHDSLTGLYSRGAIIDILRKAVSRRERRAFPLSIIFADLDNFKRTNDSYGHQAGDAVLQEAAGRVTELLRPYDSCGRYGGEELLIVLPECGAGDALAIAERMRSAIADQPIATTFGLIPASVSLGVTTVDGKAPFSIEELIRFADSALYEAKKKGRNRVVVAAQTVTLHKKKRVAPSTGA